MPKREKVVGNFNSSTRNHLLPSSLPSFFQYTSYIVINYVINRGCLNVCVLFFFPKDCVLELFPKFRDEN